VYARNGDRSHAPGIEALTRRISLEPQRALRDHHPAARFTGECDHTLNEIVRPARTVRVLPCDDCAAPWPSAADAQQPITGTQRRFHAVTRDHDDEEATTQALDEEAGQEHHRRSAVYALS
jgi:hypothetical protein